MASFIAGVRSPALPIQVVQPYAVTPKPSFSRYGSRPAASRYLVTTREPGASDVLMCGATFRPASTAFFATRPAASRTLGFEVLVQEVIAAIRTSPFLILMPSEVVNSFSRSSAFLLKPFSATGLQTGQRMSI
jgi:hypothetical protein